MNRHLKSVTSIMTIGAMWWLLKKFPKAKSAISFGLRTPEHFGLRTRFIDTQPMEQSIDDMIEASFPASDSSAWTPVAGTGRIGH